MCHSQRQRAAKVLSRQNARALTNTTEIDMAKRLDPDQDLLTALRERAPTAAEALISAYGDRAYRLAARITGNEQDAEEAVQDAFWNVIQKIDTFRGDAGLGSWLYRIVANAAYTKIRSERRRRLDRSLDDVPDLFDEHGRHCDTIVDWSARIEDPSIRGELRGVLTAALDALPLAYRTPIVLRDIEGLSPREIGQTLSISPGCAKTRVHRARLFLRKRLADFMTGATASDAAPSRERVDEDTVCRDGWSPTVRPEGETYFAA
jgi:RNA polymerase sigma-70 factor, ECF subfamily